MDDHRTALHRFAFPGVVVVCLLGLVLARLHSFVLFHSLTEMVSTVIAASLFVIAWNTRRLHRDGFFLTLGIGHAYITLINIMHTLAYQGMGVFHHHDANLATELWLAGQALQSVTLLVAPFLVHRALRAWPLLSIYGLVTAAMLALVGANTVPQTIGPNGPTAFKQGVEFVICLVLLGSIASMWHKRRSFDRYVLWLSIAAIALMTVAEFLFAWYRAIDDNLNMAAHLVRMVALTLLYRALIEAGLKRPYALLFRELKQSEDMLDQAGRIGRLAGWEWDARDGSVRCTSALEQVLRWSGPPPINLPALAEALGPASGPRLTDAIYAAAESGRGFSLELSCPRGERELWLSVLARCKTTQSGRVNGVFGVIQDITERREVEAERIAFENRIQQAEKLESLGILAGGIAHDFNNLLVAILGNAELALTGIPEDSSAAVNVQEIRRASERASDLSRQMLAYAGRAQFVSESVDLNHAIRDMVGLLQAGMPDTVEFTLALDPVDPVAQGDPTQLRQIVMSLATNAAEACGLETGHVTLRTGIADVDGDALNALAGQLACRSGTYVYLEVEDDGCGMDDETRARLFEPFFSTKFTGRGLGLAAVYGIVRSHQGCIEVHSTPGEGARVRVYLPASEPQAPSVTAPTVPLRIGSGPVLLVDDEPAVRRAGEALLRRLGYTPLLARNGPEGIDVVRERREQLLAVILDRTMPGMSGENTMAEIRRIAPDLPIVLCSGYSADDLAESVDRSVRYLQKPFHLTDLSESLAGLER